MNLFSIPRGTCTRWVDTAVMPRTSTNAGTTKASSPSAAAATATAKGGSAFAAAKAASAPAAGTAAVADDEKGGGVPPLCVTVTPASSASLDDVRCFFSRLFESLYLFVIPVSDSNDHQCTVVSADRPSCGNACAHTLAPCPRMLTPACGSNVRDRNNRICRMGRSWC
jgi:hypothetical protein